MWGGRLNGPSDPSVSGIAERQINEIERVVRPTDAQRAALGDLRAASTKAAEAVRGACPREIPQTSAQQMAFIKKGMEVMLEVLRTVRPAFEAFYTTMSDEQKAVLIPSARAAGLALAVRTGSSRKAERCLPDKPRRQCGCCFFEAY
jgi:LTXXQ motif family protein